MKRCCCFLLHIFHQFVDYFQSIQIYLKHYKQLCFYIDFRLVDGNHHVSMVQLNRSCTHGQKDSINVNNRVKWLLQFSGNVKLVSIVQISVYDSKNDSFLFYISSESCINTWIVESFHSKEGKTEWWCKNAIYSHRYLI